ncbi:MAG: hypothetical protein WCP39_05595, partial [Chlamydiota bacterium]
PAHSRVGCAPHADDGSRPRAVDENDEQNSFKNVGLSSNRPARSITPINGSGAAGGKNRSLLLIQLAPINLSHLSCDKHLH